MVQISRSSALSSQLHQCCCLVFFSVLLYFLAALACVSCISCTSLALSLYDFLPSLLTCLRKCVSSFVHQRLDFGVISVIGTSSPIASWMAPVRARHALSICL